MLDIHKLMAALFAVFLFAGAAHSASYQGYVYEVSGDVQAAIGTAKPVKVEKTRIWATTPRSPLAPIVLLSSNSLMAPSLP